MLQNMFPYIPYICLLWWPLCSNLNHRIKLSHEWMGASSVITSVKETFTVHKTVTFIRVTFSIQLRHCCQSNGVYHFYQTDILPCRSPVTMEEIQPWAWIKQGESHSKRVVHGPSRRRACPSPAHIVWWLIFGLQHVAHGPKRTGQTQSSCKIYTP